VRTGGTNTKLQPSETSMSNEGKQYLKSVRPYSSENVDKSCMHTITHIIVMYKLIILINTLFLQFSRDITHPLYMHVDDTFHGQAVGLVFQCKTKKSAWCVGPKYIKLPPYHQLNRNQLTQNSVIITANQEKYIKLYALGIYIPSRNKYKVPRFPKFKIQEMQLFAQNFSH